MGPTYDTRAPSGRCARLEDRVRAWGSQEALVAAPGWHQLNPGPRQGAAFLGFDLSIWDVMVACADEGDEWGGDELSGVSPVEKPADPPKKPKPKRTSKARRKDLGRTSRSFTR